MRGSVIPSIVVHGGVGSPDSFSDGCRAAAEVGMKMLRAGEGALEAAVAAVVRMENDGRFNAGSGSVLRLDGRTIEMDAAVMDSAGALGAVAAVSDVKNPVVLARAVSRSPHVILAGVGATALARRMGMPGHPGPSARALLNHRALAEALRGGKLAQRIPSWRWEDAEQFWNFDSDIWDIVPPGDTVGVVALDARGVFAAATSTGGASPMLRGRVGDAPIIGCGFYAGVFGAVAATGVGEEVIRRLASLLVYQQLERGATPEEACRHGVSLFPEEVPVGFIAVGVGGAGAANNREMARHSLRSDAASL